MTEEKDGCTMKRVWITGGLDVKFEIEITDGKEIADIFKKISDEEICKIQQICERYGEEEDDVRYYDVYVITTSSDRKILKKTQCREVSNYEKFLKNKHFSVPTYYGKWENDNDFWILIENVSGNDLRDMTDELALAAADSIAEIQNAYWMDDEEAFAKNKADDRFGVYWKRINKRYDYIKNEPIIGEAYSIFLKRQLACPRTLSNGDFLEFNVLNHDNRVCIIDWGFGGIMPYSLDIARFIAHATVDRATFPFYMSDNQKELFVEKVYKQLIRKPDHSQYIYDIKLAILNEYVEFVEADEDEDGWYYKHALQLSKEILEIQNK